MEIDIDMSQFHDIFFEEAIEGIEIMEKDITKLSRNEFDVLRTEIGFLFQGSALYD